MNGFDNDKYSDANHIENSDKKFLTEYEVINQWRMSLVSNNYILTYIFVPLSVVTFSSYYLASNGSCPCHWLFFMFSIILIGFWRIIAWGGIY